MMSHADRRDDSAKFITAAALPPAPRGRFEIKT
jgi:hypothetical protein